MLQHRPRRAHLARLACLILIPVAVILLLFCADSGVNRANLDFIRSYGWEVKEKPEEISHLTIPAVFDSVLSAYNQAVAAAGFDLTPYQGVSATRYTYQVLNHRESETGLIRIHVFVTKDGIVSADLCSLAPGGFLLPISDTSGQLP